MTASRRFHALIFLMVIALLGSGRLALAQGTHHWQIRGAPQQAVSADADRGGTTPAPNLYALQATLTQMSPTIGANADGTDLWPCFGFTPSPNPDCPTVGNPSIPLPTGGAVLGFPSYVWQLHNTQGTARGNASGWGCDALLNGTTGPAGAAYKPCSQIATWYEDTTNDSTDDLLQRIVITQGRNIIYDSGIVDYGPAGPTVTYPVDVILQTDANFGFWTGAATGPNNGNCSPDTGYPLAAPANPGKIYVVESGQTCREPATGPAQFHTETVLATPTYVPTTGAACTAKGVASPCFTVEWARKYEIRQDFAIFLE